MHNSSDFSEIDHGKYIESTTPIKASPEILAIAKRQRETQFQAVQDAIDRASTRSHKRSAALEQLRSIIHDAGDKLWTITRYRNAAGTYRCMDVYFGFSLAAMDKRARITDLVAAALGYRLDKRHNALGIGGPERDYGKQIAEQLSMALFGATGKLRVEEI